MGDRIILRLDRLLPFKCHISIRPEFGVGVDTSHEWPVVGRRTKIFRLSVVSWDGIVLANAPVWSGLPGPLQLPWSVLGCLDDSVMIDG